MELRIKANGADYVIPAGITTDSLQEAWKPDDYSYLNFNAIIDNYTLSQIEKIRGGSNLHLKINVKFLAYPSDRPDSVHEYYFGYDLEIPKSKWVKDVLPAIGYKNTLLVEMPKLKHEKLNDAIARLDDAWKSYSMGEFDEVLVKCRKALEEITNSIKREGFYKKDTNDSGIEKTAFLPFLEK